MIDTHAIEQRSRWLNITIENLRGTLTALQDGATKDHIQETLNGYLREQYQLTSELATVRALAYRGVGR